MKRIVLWAIVAGMLLMNSLAVCADAEEFQRKAASNQPEEPIVGLSGNENIGDLSAYSETMDNQDQEALTESEPIQEDQAGEPPSPENDITIGETEDITQDQPGDPNAGPVDGSEETPKQEPGSSEETPNETPGEAPNQTPEPETPGETPEEPGSPEETPNETPNVPETSNEQEEPKQPELPAEEITEPEEELTIGMSGLEPLQETGFSVEKVDYTSQVKGTLDPYNLNGNGQIAYEDIVITNNNTVPVRMKLDQVNFQSKGGAFLTLQPLDADNMEKWVVLTLNRETERTDENVLVPGEQMIDFGTLEAGESTSLKLDGIVGTNACGWSADDKISVSFHFVFEEVR